MAMALTFDPDILDTLEERVVKDWKGYAWRVVIGLTEALRPNQRGARWNPPLTEALYCSLSEDLALKEIEALLDRQPVAITKRKVPYRLRVRLNRVIELETGAELEAFGVLQDELLGEDLTNAQRIGAAVAWLGIAGLIVPSARGDGQNLVIFTNCLDPGDIVEIDNGLE